MKRTCLPNLLLVLSAALFLAPVARAADAPLPAGVKAVWDMDKAAHETTATRERICINGLWRWQPLKADPAAVPADNWGYFKVPGPWPGRNDYMFKDSQKLHKHASWADTKLAEVTEAWYQREITIPQTWKDRRIALTFDCLNSYAAVYLDGHKAGEAYFPAGAVDLTAACRPGAKQLLSIYVKAAPLGAVVMAFTDTGVPKEVKGTVERKGLCGDVFLESTPKGPRLGGVLVETSVRNWTIGFNTEIPELPANTRYILKAQVADDGKAVKEFASPPFSAAELKDGRYRFTSPWKPDKLWDTITPQNMYQAQLTLASAEGQVIDILPPVRFGFREFWIEGRDFYLNGTRFYSSLVGTENGQIGAAWANYEAAKETFLRDKAYGINTVYTHNYGCAPGAHVGYEEILRAADDTGMLVALSQPHTGNYTWNVSDGGQSNGYARTAACYVRVAGNHPSVVLYAMDHNSTSYAERENPDVIDGKHNNEGKLGPRTDKAGLNGLQGQAIIEALDPTRVVYHQSAGSLGHTYSINVYLNWTPIQEVCDWFNHWSKEGIQPLILTEFDTPYDTDWTMFRGWFAGARNWGSKPVAWETCVGEWNASLLGDRAFQLCDIDKENLRWEADKWKNEANWFRWSYPHAIVGASTAGNQDKQTVRAMYITENWRGFRLAGVTATNEFCADSFWALRKGLNYRENHELKVDWDTIQKPGFSPDFAVSYNSPVLGFEKSDWTPGPAAQALLRNNMPLLAFIGGKSAHLTCQEHNYLPGETFEKTFVVINNSRLKLDGDCAWTLALPQAVVGHKQCSIQTGDQEHIPVSFTVPPDTQPGSYELSMTAKFSNGETQTDAFKIDVLAPSSPVKALPKTALFDPKGETAALLKSLDVSATPVEAGADLKNFDLLIVGKGALTLEAPAPNISRLREGLKVIMFEQTAKVLEQRFGFRVQEYGLRNAFARLPDHPLLAGLNQENLHDWRGQATLLPPRLTGYPAGANGEFTVPWCGISVKRTYRNGNLGSLASALIEKPAKGDFLPIVDGGFSLQFSPLLVYREGQGMMILCQMDVTARSEEEPAARKLVTNILDYVNAWKPAPSRTVVYAGEEAGKVLLQRAGFSPARYAGGQPTAAQVLVVGAGASQTLGANAAALRQWIKGGGNVLALGLNQEDANAFLPFTIKTTKAEHIGTVFAPPAAKSLLAGVGPAEVLNHDPREMALISGGATVLGDGVLACGDGAPVVLSQMAPWQYDYEKKNKFLPAYNLKRTFRRTAYLVARVLGNMGASAPTPLLERFASPPASKTPWLDAFYLDKPEQWDDPYRFFRW